jgi:Ser/Thr protein kinase RdoA (MazF antagonist)
MSGSPARPPLAVLELLGNPEVRVEPLDPRGQPWLVEAEDWKAVLRRFSLSSGLEHVEWLHRFLDRLSHTGFPAPRPLTILGDASVVVVDDAIWEAVSFLPGRRLNWDPWVPLGSAGALLARFHRASLAMSVPDQRPGALPMEAYCPASEASLADRFQCDLADVGHLSAARCVVHGDATPANMLVAGLTPKVTGLIDFVLAHVGPPESDISFALWVAGRTEQPAIMLDADRVRAFVAGYHRVRPLGDWAARAIPLYLVGRGLQMLARLERVGLRDEIQSNRLHWLDANRRWFEDVVASALASQTDVCEETAG